MRIINRDNPSTSLSMLERVRHNEAEAWRRLCCVYGPLVYRWARVAGLQDSDAADVGQDVFRTVFDKIGEYDGLRSGATFRGWLRTITKNKVGDFLRRRSHRPAAVGGTTAWHFHEQLPDELSDDGVVPLNEEQRLLHRTLATLQVEFEPLTWKAFWMSMMEDLAAAEIADKLGLSAGAVRQAKYRVLRRLKDELGVSNGDALLP